MRSGRDGVWRGAVGVWGERFGKDADRDWVIVAGGDGRGTGEPGREVERLPLPPMNHVND